MTWRPAVWKVPATGSYNTMNSVVGIPTKALHFFSFVGIVSEESILT